MPQDIRDVETASNALDAVANGRPVQLTPKEIVELAAWLARVAMRMEGK